MLFRETDMGVGEAHLSRAIKILRADSTVASAVVIAQVSAQEVVAWERMDSNGQ